MNRLVIFDLDGTLADTSPNIFESYRHVAQVLNMNEPDKESIYASLGGFLTNNISKLFRIGDDKIAEAVEIYRSFYATLPPVKPYAGIPDVINILKQNGFILAVATLKREDFARKLLDYWNLTNHFEFIIGSNRADTISKSEMIDTCIEHTQISKDHTTMIGDSISDYEAAKNSMVSFIAASYGFSLPSRYCIENAIPYVLDPIGILNLLLL